MKHNQQIDPYQVVKHVDIDKRDHFLWIQFDFLVRIQSEEELTTTPEPTVRIVLDSFEKIFAYL